MTTAIQRSSHLTFDAFLDYDDGTGNLYELIDGKVIIVPESSRLHQSIAGFFDRTLTQEIDRDGRSWEVVRNTVIRAPGRLLANGRRPDLAIVDRPKSDAEADQKGIITTPHFVIEIASVNRANDLRDKIFAYLHLGVPEYWVLDYKGQIPEKYCERDKGVKTIVFTLRESGGYGYDKQEFLADEPIDCRTFPQLQLSTNQIINCISID